MTNEDKILEMLLDLQKDIKAINERTARMEKEHGLKINGLYESVVGTGEKFSRLDLLDSKVDDHEHRLFAVEENLKQA